AKDVSPNILAGNPHADRHGNRKVWHFFGEPATSEQVAKVPAGSVLAKWRNASSDAERAKLAAELQALLKTAREAVPAGSPDAALRQQLLSSTGPLLSAAMRTVTAQANDTAGSSSAYGL